MLTVKDFLIDKTAFVKSTEEILFFGSFVYKVLSDEDSKLVVNTLRSVTSNVVVGNFP
jgi:CRISPR/Cas system CMR-associated protein Cmr3 (group 5 of RAMP superfamily)